MNALNASALVVNLADLGAQHKFLSVRFLVFSFVVSAAAAVYLDKTKT